MAHFEIFYLVLWSGCRDRHRGGIHLTIQRDYQLSSRFSDIFLSLTWQLQQQSISKYRPDIY